MRQGQAIAQLVVNGGVLLVAGAHLHHGRKPWTDAELDRWATGRGVTLDGGQRERVASQLRRSRSARRVGLLLPLILSSLHELGAWSYRLMELSRGVPQAWPDRNFGQVFLTVLVAGYVLGAITAELRRPRPGSAAAPAAAVAPRRLNQYLSRPIRWGLLAVPLGMALVHIWAETRPVEHWGTVEDGGIVYRSSFPLVIVAVLVALAVFGCLQWLVRRPQPLEGAEDLAVDDALRASALQTVAGAGLGGLLWLTAAEFYRLGDVVSTSSAAAALAGLYLWTRLDGLPAWLVRRGPASVPVVTR